MNDNNGLCVKTEEISRLAMEEVHEVMIKEEAAVCGRSAPTLVFSKAAYPATNVKKTSKFHGSSLHDIENQIIRCNWTKTGKIKPTIQTDLGISPSQNHSFSLMETLQSRYIKKGGYFQHIFVFSEIQSVSSSICFGVLNIRNEDQLLSINDEDVTLMTHSEVTVLLNTYPATNVQKTSKFHGSSLHDIENQIIRFNWTKTGKIKPTIQTDLGISPSQNNSFSLMETLQSRNEDQLLSINDEDVTLMTHSEVTVLLNSQPIDINENITMNYLRPSTENIKETNFTLYQPFVAAKLNHETSTPSRHWKAQRKVTLKKRGTNKFLQRLKNDHVGFEELISSKLGINVGGFHQCHFIEERELNSGNTGFIRWYLDEERKQYLYVTKDGNITLQANTAFKINSSSHGAFVILEEMDTSKLLSLHDITAQFIKFKSNHVDKDSIDHIPEKFRFDLDKIRC
ncbi:unnamed protein product [Mytilus coruscus]|uniref:Uncharacterized protein n=1 Tax=Mytilus coruscus TaxID=42192 RepID=A0A6J8C636_MYTCO|nr:unnamed protein product [Mytilus coruscus]